MRLEVDELTAKIDSVESLISSLDLMREYTSRLSGTLSISVDSVAVDNCDVSVGSRGVRDLETILKYTMAESEQRPQPEKGEVKELERDADELKVVASMADSWVRGCEGVK